MRLPIAGVGHRCLVWRVGPVPRWPSCRCRREDGRRRRPPAGPALTEGEPDGVLLTACGNRRASRCPSCSQTYRGDAFQLISAGLAGGKGVPASVAEHPRLFVTLTAPSFGPVHAIRERRGLLLPCHPRDPQRRCPHGRALARLTGTSEAAVKRRVRVRFAKVAEYQRRGVIHYHAILRIDAALPPGDQEQVAPPPAGFTVDLLTRAVHLAVHGDEGFHPAAVPAPVVGVRLPLVATWGAQLDVRPIGERGELSAERVAGYVAKYATKGTEAAGAVLDHRQI